MQVSIEKDNARIEYDLRLNIYDCAGDNENMNLLKVYFKNVSVVVLVYSINSNDSHQRIQSWIEAVNKTKQPGSVVHFALVGTKKDLDRVVPQNAGNLLKK